MRLLFNKFVVDTVIAYFNHKANIIAQIAINKLKVFIFRPDISTHTAEIFPDYICQFINSFHHTTLDTNQGKYHRKEKVK